MFILKHSLLILIFFKRHRAYIQFQFKVSNIHSNCVRHAILSAPNNFAYAIVSGAMQFKPSGGHVHDRTCKRACLYWTIRIAAWIFTYFYYCGETFPMSFMTCTFVFACKKMANVFRRPRAFNLLQGRFCTGADTTAYANMSGRTQSHYAAASGRTRLHMQDRPADIIAYAIMSSG